MKKLLVLILIILVIVNIPMVCVQTNSSWRQITEFKIHITNVVGFLNGLTDLPSETEVVLLLYQRRRQDLDSSPK